VRVLGVAGRIYTTMKVHRLRLRQQKWPEVRMLRREAGMQAEGRKLNSLLKSDARALLNQMQGAIGRMPVAWRW